MKTVAWVPIKLNNERLPNKNILPLGDKPLCRHMLETLLDVKHIDDIYVFCSDEKITEYLPTGVKFLRRDKALDEPHVGHYEIVESFISLVDADVYVNAHVTNPFIKAATIQDGLNRVLSNEYESANAALPLRKHIWFGKEPLNFTRTFLPRTQDLSSLYMDMNLCIYKRDVYAKGRSRYSMEPYFMLLDEIESVDIDYPNDYILAQAIYTLINEQKGATPC